MLERYRKLRSRYKDHLAIFMISGAIVSVFMVSLSIYMRGVWQLSTAGFFIAAVSASIAGGSRMNALAFWVFKIGPLRRPPASRLVAALRAIFPKRAFEMVFSQTVIDFREEHSEMLAEGRRGRARWLTVCLWGTLILTVVTWCATTIAKRIVSIWKLS